MSQIGSVDSDNFVFYCSLQGTDKDGRPRRLEKAYKIMPKKLGNKMLRAKQTTTPTPLCEMTIMMVRKNMKRIFFQSQASTKEFIDGEFVKDNYGEY